MTRTEYTCIYNIIGAAMEVHHLIGRGMSEPIYQECLEIELVKRGFCVEREKLLNLWYKGVKLKKFYQADFYCQGILVEIKSVSTLNHEHRAQLFNYMRMSHINLGLLINFGERSLNCERFLYNNEHDDFILINDTNYINYIKE